MTYDRTVRLDRGFASAMTAVREALADRGFGILTGIDVTATLKGQTLGHDLEDYLILCAGNPSLAHQALEADRAVGLLLPCNVVVRAEGATTVVHALDRTTMVPLTGPPGLEPVDSAWPPSPDHRATTEHARPRASHQKAAAGTDHLYTCHTDGWGTERHSSTRWPASCTDQMYASATIPRPRRDPGPGHLGAQQASARPTRPLTLMRYALAGGRAPPSLAEPHLLRIQDNASAARRPQARLPAAYWYVLL